MSFTGTFNFADWHLYKGLFQNPMKILDRHGYRRSKIIATYAIENTRTKMAYVGSTECVMTRWLKHLVDLKANRHSNESLQTEFNRDGASAYTFRILRSCETTDGLQALEEVDGLANFKTEDLHNVRLGWRFLHGANNFLSQNGRTKRSTGKIIGRTNSKARWFDGTGVQA